MVRAPDRCNRTRIMPGPEVLRAIEVRGLPPPLLDDGTAFFDGPAFVDNAHWASCSYCFHHTPDPEIRDARTVRQGDVGTG